MYVKCCIPSCTSTRQDVKLHKFPSCKGQRNKWLESINCVQLKQMDPSKLDKLLVCHKHIEARFHTKISGIKKTAYPTLFSSEEIETGVPSLKSDDKENVLCDHSYAKERHHDHTYCKEGTPGLLHEVEPLRDQKAPISKLDQQTVSNDRTAETKEHSTSADSEMSGTEIPTSNTKEDLSTTNSSILQRQLLYKSMTPRCRRLYREYEKNKKVTDICKRAENAIDFTKEKTFINITTMASNNRMRLLTKLRKLCRPSKRGFTYAERLICLSVLQECPDWYCFLERIFLLPSEQSLIQVAATLKMAAGVDVHIFKALEQEVQTWPESKRYCCILFDEIALESDRSPRHTQAVEEDTESFDHSVVFMVRGVLHDWCQPTAFYPSVGPTSCTDLQTMVEDMVSAVIGVGLVPLALVCDQRATFQWALQTLQEETRQMVHSDGGIVDDEIILCDHRLNVIYDPLHLLKGVRDEFLTKDIKFDGKVCKWSDIVEVYRTDRSQQSPLLHKLNDEDVIPELINKTEVQNCVRVFSKTVAAAMSFTSNFSTYKTGAAVSGTMKNTAELILFLDTLFDSVNGVNLLHKTDKPLSCVVTNRSHHQQFWQQAIFQLSAMRFIQSSQKFVLPQQCWIVTLKSFMRLWIYLQGRNMQCMRPRYFNSEPMQRFSTVVRKRQSLDYNAFKNTFKLLFVNSYIRLCSVSYNCERSAEYMAKLKFLFSASTTLGDG